MRRLVHNRTGASAAEFSLVLPLLMLMLFGMIDTGRYMWEVNRAEKATQMGARMAVVTDVVPQALPGTTFLGTANCDLDNNGSYEICTQGDTINNPSAIPTITCTVSGCTPNAYAAMTPGAFTRIADRMRLMKADITDANVQVIYTGSGLGYAGDPNGMEVAPLVTVKLTGVKFKALTSLMLANINMPDFASTLTAEDSSGTVSN